MKNKISKIIIIISYLIMLVFFIMLLISRHDIKIANYIVFNIISPINSLLFYITQYIPITIKYIFLFITPLLVLLSYILYVLVNKAETVNKLLSNILFIIFNLLISIFIIKITIFYIIPTSSNIDVFYLTEYKYKEYKEEFFYEYIEYIYNQVDTYSNLIPRTNNKIELNNINKIAINNLKNIKDKYPFLKGIYPTHYGNISYNQSTQSTGYTSNITFSINIMDDLNPIAELNNITHELCHAKGIDKESDAVFCTYEAGIYSKDIISNYAAYYEVFTRIYEILYFSNNKYLSTYQELINNKCTINNYEEFCNYNYKELKEIKQESNRFYLKTFYLSNIDYKNKIINNLKELNNYNIRIYDNNYNTIDINNIPDINYIHIFIEIDHNFNKIKEILDSNKELYYQIRQVNSDDIMYRRPSGNLSINRYIKQFAKKSEMSTDYKTENSYSRSIRLLLEKYDYEKRNE
ncbi:MAG: DUF3810 family protein [Bacilli bacterium]|nr:DUF3810 family protein [Bacilli bacterium]